MACVRGVRVASGTEASKTSRVLWLTLKKKVSLDEGEPLFTNPVNFTVNFPKTK